MSVIPRSNLSKWITGTGLWGEGAWITGKVLLIHFFPMIHPRDPRSGSKRGTRP